MSQNLQGRPTGHKGLEKKIKYLKGVSSIHGDHLLKI